MKLLSFSLSERVQAEAKSASVAPYKSTMPFPFGNVSFLDMEWNSCPESSIWENPSLTVPRLWDMSPPGTEMNPAHLNLDS